MSMKYPYRDLGVPFDRNFRNDLNANFDDIEHDIRMIGGEAAQQALEAAEEANTQAIYAQTSGDYANDKGDYAAQQGDYAQTQGNFANEKGLYAQQQGDYAKAQGDYAKQVGDENKTRWLNPVATFADIATTYPNPQLGDTVQTIDDSKIYRWDGTQWVWTQQYNANAITDVQNKIGILFKRAKGISPYEFGAVGDGVADDTQSFINALNYSKTNKVPLILHGTFKIISGLLGSSYELEDVTIISNNATINADTLTGDNVVLQLGSNTAIHGHLEINVTGTSGNGNGFVRLPICIGRWWDASYEVKNVYIESVKLSNSYSESNLIAITANASNINIKNVEASGIYARAILVHWSGVPNNTNPTTTFHPYNIKIGNIYAKNALESIVTLSACYNVEIDNITGDNNYRGLFAIAGDYADKYALPFQQGLVGYGIEINNLSGTNYVYRAFEVNGRAGLATPTYDIEIPVRIKGGVCQGKPTSDNGVVVNYSVGGSCENLKVTGFVNGFLPGDGCKKWKLKNTKAIKNRNGGYRFNLSSGSVEDVILEGVVSENNNTSLTGGVSEIYIGNNAKRIKVLEPYIATDNTATHGITVEGSATDCVVEGGYATGFSGSRYAYRSHASPDNNNLFKDNSGDNTANLYSDNGNPILIQKLSYGKRRFLFSGIPISGTYYQGDEVIYTNTVAGGKRGAVCVVAGTPGTWKQFGAIDA
jgi:hypothetical protein